MLKTNPTDKSRSNWKTRNNRGKKLRKKSNRSMQMSTTVSLHMLTFTYWVKFKLNVTSHLTFQYFRQIQQVLKSRINWKTFTRNILGTNKETNPTDPDIIFSLAHICFHAHTYFYIAWTKCEDQAHPRGPVYKHKMTLLHSTFHSAPAKLKYRVI